MKGLFRLASAACLVLMDWMPLSAFAHDLIPLWELHGDVIQGVSIKDTFYTTYANDRDLAGPVANGGLGYTVRGIAAWLPCSLSTDLGPNGEQGSATSSSDANHGYASFPYQNTAFHCALVRGSTKLFRLYKGAPAYDHIFTTSVTEFNSLVAQGYEFDRVDGYVFTSQITGTVALYRLSSGVGIPNHDIEHRYTISTIARQTLLNNGWTDEGITGYVFAAPDATTVSDTGINGHYNGSTVTTSTFTTIPITNVVPPVAGFSLYADRNSSNTTVKPSGAVWQQIDYQIYTGDIFSYSGSAANFTHMPVYLHYLGTPSVSDLCCVMSYDGLALVFGTTDMAHKVPGTGGPPCATGDSTTGQLYFEFGQEGRAILAGQNLLCDPKLSVNLQNNTTYKFTFSIDDAANVKITVGKLNTGTGQFDAQTFAKTGTTTFTENLSSYYACPLNPTVSNLSPSTTYCTNPETGDRWPVGKTGYMMNPAWDKYPNTPDNTATISLVHHHWLDGSGNILN
jgi:hypothetical protein